MSLRVAFDLDGVLADLGTAYDAVAAEVAATRVTSLGRDATTPGDDGDRSETDSDDTAAGSRSQADDAEIWAAIRAVSDFWTTLSPLEPGGIERLQATATTSLGTVLLDPAGLCPEFRGKVLAEPLLNLCTSVGCLSSHLNVAG